MVDHHLENQLLDSSDIIELVKLQKLFKHLDTLNPDQLDEFSHILGKIVVVHLGTQRAITEKFSELSLKVSNFAIDK